MNLSLLRCPTFFGFYDFWQDKSFHFFGCSPFILFPEFSHCKKLRFFWCSWAFYNLCCILGLYLDHWVTFFFVLFFATQKLKFFWVFCLYIFFSLMLAKLFQWIIFLYFFNPFELDTSSFDFQIYDMLYYHIYVILYLYGQMIEYSSFGLLCLWFVLGHRDFNLHFDVEALNIRSLNYIYSLLEI